MKKFLLVLSLFLLLFSITINGDVILESPKIDDDESQRTLQTINEVRNQQNLEPLVVNQKLSKMALSHSKYMSYYSTLTSIEQNGKLYFSGRYPWDRADYYKYEKKAIFEFVKKDIGNYLEGFNQLMSDPLTRVDLMDPTYTEIGMSVEKNYFTYDLAGDLEEQQQLVTYPYNKQMDVETNWYGDSFSSLYKDIKLKGATVGMPITITLYGNHSFEIINVNASLIKKDSQEAVEFRTFNSEDIHQLKDSIVLLPLESYDYSTTYVAQISFSTKDNNGLIKNYNERIEFKTNGLTLKFNEVKYLTRADFIENIMTNKLLNFTIQEPLELKFTDVSIKSTESMYIYTASLEQLISGYPDQSFRPKLNITKEQAYKILVNAYEKKFPMIRIDENEGLLTYSDSDSISGWAYESIKKAAKLGILLVEDYKIQPKYYLRVDELNQIMESYNRVIIENKNKSLH